MEGFQDNSLSKEPLHLPPPCVLYQDTEHASKWRDKLHDKDVEMEALISEMSKMQVTAPLIPPKQVDY